MMMEAYQTRRWPRGKCVYTPPPMSVENPTMLLLAVDYSMLLLIPYDRTAC